MVMGRPTIYNEQMADAICEGLAEGLSLITVLKSNDALPSYSTVMRWLRENPDFQQNYKTSREYQADHDADKIGEIAEEVRKGLVDPASARVAIDAYKWAAGKRKSKMYGDKIDVEQTTAISVTHTLDVSNLSMDELDALEKALSNV